MRHDSEFNTVSQQTFRRICELSFSLWHGGRSDISQHNKTQKHKNARNIRTVSASVSSFFVQNSHGEKVAAPKELFAYHTVRHGQTFEPNDCFATD